MFAVDEKPQIQALQPTAPVLHMLPGVPQRRSQDHIRDGTVDLLAALNTATGKVIGKLSARYRAWTSATSPATSTARPSRAWRSTSSATTYSVLTRLPGDARLAPADAARC